MDWQKFIFDPENNTIKKMEHIAYKRFFDQNYADEAFNYSLEKLQENNWAKLKKYTGKNGASALTFFCHVFTNLVEDFARSKLGRCTPPVWIEKLGGFWVKLFKQLCCESMEQQVLQVVYKETNIDEQELNSAIKTIKQKDPKCTTRGKTHAQISLDCQDDEHVAPSLPSQSISEECSKEHFEQVIEALNHWLNDNGNCSHEQTQELFNALNKIELSDESVLLLRLVYQERLKVPKAAEFIGIKAYTARRRINDALEKIQKTLKERGISTFSE